jgi:hypothetical protein
MIVVAHLAALCLMLHCQAGNSDAIQCNIALSSSGPQGSATKGTSQTIPVTSSPSHIAGASAVQ